MSNSQLAFMTAPEEHALNHPDFETTGQSSDVYDAIEQALAYLCAGAIFANSEHLTPESASCLLAWFVPHVVASMGSREDVNWQLRRFTSAAFNAVLSTFHLPTLVGLGLVSALITMSSTEKLV